MAVNQRKSFEANYRESLKKHLAGKNRARTRSRGAVNMGKEAVALGMNAQELARTHEQVKRSLEPTGTSYGNKTLSPNSDTTFLIDALEPFEKVRHVEETKYQQIEKSLERQLLQGRKRHDKLLAESQREKELVRQLTHQFFLAQEKERKEISRELHDEIAQVLAGINVRLAALKKVAQRDTRDIGERIDQTQKLVEQSVAAVHRYALRLRPSMLDDLGLVPSLRSYINSVVGRKNLSIQFKASKEVDFLGNEQRTALYRVAQEALTNVVRHSRAKHVKVSLQKLDQSVLLEIHDDGKGFDAKRILNSMSIKRLGLRGMRERVDMLGGKFSIVSSPGNGTTIAAQIPQGLAPIKNAQ